MSARDELRRFVHDALTRGVPRAQVENALVEAGWSTPQVKTALAGFAESAFNLGNLLFALIDWAVPQAAPLAGTLRSAIRQPVASLVVAVPVFLFTSRVVSRSTAPRRPRGVSCA